MRIRSLANFPEHLEGVAGWIHREFIDAEKMSLEHLVMKFRGMHADRIPLTLIALEDGECIGTVSLFSSDLASRRDLSPWLAALYVPREKRGMGTGRSLVAACVEKAAELGHESLFLRTEHAAGFYRKLGWEHYSDENAEGGVPTAVFRIAI